MSYKSFKNEIENYEEYCRNVRILKDEIEGILYELSGVKGISYDKIPSSFNPSLSEERRLELIDLYNQKLEDLKHFLSTIRYVDKRLRGLTADEKRIILDVVSGRLTYEEAGKRHGYSKGRMWKKIKKILEEIL